MISVQVKTSTTRQVVSVDTTSTPRDVFNELQISPSGAMINLDGTILSATDLNSSFEQLGVADGQSCNLNCVVKADGANR